MTALVKICGLSEEATLEAALAAGADFVGLVHFSKSPRHVSADRAAVLADRARGRTQIVLLSVDATPAELDGLVRTIRPDALQLHGRESPETVAGAREKFGLPVWKAVAIAAPADLGRAAAYAGIADRMLFDAKAPADATRPGGNGLAFDWGILSGAAPGFILSGGLAPENVAEAIRKTSPWAVDVSSGVEAAPGRKDPERIAAFVKAARSAAPALSRAS
jgi:phosphoribosylanthranilate isomerase